MKSEILNQELQNKWQVYESYVLTKSQKGDFRVQQIGQIQNVQEFVEFIQFLPHGKPSQLFSNIAENYQVRYEIKDENQLGQWQTIDSVYIFRDGILPEWENEENKNGCEYRQSLADCTAQEVDQIWLLLLSKIFSNEFPNSKKYINGIKICEKLQNSKQFIRLDLWLKIDIDFNDRENQADHENIKVLFQNTIKDVLKREVKDLTYYGHKQEKN